MIGARIKQARLLAGLTQQQLADELGNMGLAISKQAISKYENEKSYPSAAFLLLASSALDVPSTYFTHQSTKEIQWLAFRRHSRLPIKEQTKIKLYARDIAELQIELRELLYPNRQHRLPAIKVATAEDAEEAAQTLRNQWDVGDRPLDNLVQTAEDRDVIVIGWQDETKLFDGLSGYCEHRPVTVLNTVFPSDRQRLTLAHELGHLVMDTQGVSAKESEALAFRFAAALLVPAKHAYAELGNSRSQLDWPELKTLKRKYGLSLAAWVRRAYELEIINQSQYRELKSELRQNGWRKCEPVAYTNDEEPLQLQQMIQRAFGEGLVSPERLELFNLDDAVSDIKPLPKSEYPSATELLEMEEAERERWMSQMYEWAQDMEFEIFEAYGEEEF